MSWGDGFRARAEYQRGRAAAGAATDTKTGVRANTMTASIFMRAVL
jgi:hypothetical protein